MRAYQEVRDCLEHLIDRSTEINGKTGFHRAENAEQLSAIFKVASEKKEFGRVVISELE
jgi:hypothetical protein